MNPTGKKLVSFFLVFSLMMLSVNLYAKERRGAKLIITKKNGYQIEGELIAVKPNSLLLLDAEGKDVSVDVEEIKVIKIVKKLKAGKGPLFGALVGGIVAVVWNLGVVVDSEDYLRVIVISSGIIVGASALLGGLIGAVAGIASKKKYQIEGMTDSEIKEVLDKLRKKACIRDYK